MKGPSCEDPMEFGKGLSSQLSLIKHQNAPTGKKPYEGTECGKLSLVRSTSLLIIDVIPVRNLINVQSVETFL